MSNPLNIQTFQTSIPLAIISLGFEITEANLGQVAMGINNFQSFYGENRDNNVVAFNIWSKRYQRSLLVVYSTGIEPNVGPFACATFYAKVVNFYSSNSSDIRDVTGNVLLSNIRVTNPEAAASFDSKVNDAAYWIITRLNNL